MSTVWVQLNLKSGLLKVSRYRNKIFEPKLLPKNKRMIFFLSWQLGNTWNLKLKSKFKFQVFPHHEDRKTNLFVCFFGRSYGLTMLFWDLLTFRWDFLSSLWLKKAEVTHFFRLCRWKSWRGRGDFLKKNKKCSMLIRDLKVDGWLDSLALLYYLQNY